MSKFLQKYFYATLIAGFCIATPAQSTTVLGFNDTAAPNGSVSVGPSYQEAGYSLQATSGVFFADSSDFVGLAQFGSDTLIFNRDVSFILTKDDNELFDLVSVLTGSLGRAFPGNSDDGNFVFTGYFGLTEIASQVVLAINTASPTLFSFSGFTGLTSLVVTTTDGRFPVMDDLTLSAVSAVPVPAALPLFGTGLAFLGFMGWRRKRKTAS